MTADPMTNAVPTAVAAPSASEVIVVRYAELFLKGQNRSFFEQKLVDGARRALADLAGCRVVRLHGRVLVELDGAPPAAALARLQRVFGIASLSPATLVPADESALAGAAVAVARSAVARSATPPRFKIKTQRSDKRFPLPSPELSRRIGARIVEALGLRVDLETPELTVGVEIGPERSFVYAETFPGPGGLPTGSAGKVALLLSGGIDSPVAGWLAAKRGCNVIPVYFHSFPYTGDKTREKVIRLARSLARWQGPGPMFVVPFTDAQKALRDAGPAELAVVLYRRMMMRVAEKIALREGARALVTGENLGQVASQTLENLAVIGAPATLPILRPLVTNDKAETIALAQRIGTYDLSVEPYEDCCSLFVPTHPATRARSAEVERAEARLDVPSLASRLAESAEPIAVEPAA